ncbi:parallel beta-helix domain-containing protein [Sphingomonas sp. SUN039]|uniref:parallel beta-helix domain-containing protein n=1 Tax=Sphingomonas sp. SUN039 TaxID=2937787 RepID=UPI002164EDB3|nr:parallel beta-helix domain-containing protein [Sphingomonas sp. SUN039]UVO55718.1 right-handed parallel beta-helix repeat-containing protein [Sphingomonas sp. SUN039]
MNKPCLYVAVFALSASPLAAKTIAVAPGPNVQEVLQTALIEAKPGDVVELAAGRYVLTDGLSLDVNGVTVRGAGPDKSILDFKSQKAAGEGLLVTSDDVVLRGFAVEDARGDAIKSKGADRIIYHDLRVEWTGGPKETNGAYGVYPVSSTDVLIDKVVVRGASDAGIYVGQSRNIIVRNSTAEVNVAGIEIENSYNADVHDNVATKNAGGILVFDLPNLPQMGGHSVRIYNNRVTDNSTPNFAPKGNIVASVPTGTGVMVMANRDVHVFGNTLADNATANVMVVAYKRPFTDATYNPLPRNVVIRDNTHGRAGWAPAFPGGDMLAKMMGGSIAPVFWDGAGGMAATNIRVTDKVGVLTMGLPEPLTPIMEAKPAPVDLSKGTAIAEPGAVVLPASMEAVVVSR